MCIRDRLCDIKMPKLDGMEVLEKINTKGDYNDEIEQGLHAAIKDFKANNTW